MKKVLSSIGIGSATVDTVFPSTSVTAGESVDAAVEVEGGSTELDVDGIYFALVTRYRQDEGSSNAIIEQFRLTDGFTVAPGEEMSIPVTIEIPPETPITMGNADVWVETGLDIDWALDPSDEDELCVRPDPYLDTLLNAVGGLGFDFHAGELITATDTPFAPDHGFVQVFQYRPVTAAYSGRLDELELVCNPTADGVEVLMEIDRKGDPTSGWTQSGEHYARFTVETTDEDEVAGRIDDVIERFA